MRYVWRESVTALGWHFVQIPAGHDGCEPDEHGTDTRYDSSERGGM